MYGKNVYDIQIINNNIEASGVVINVVKIDGANSNSISILNNTIKSQSWQRCLFVNGASTSTNKWAFVKDNKIYNSNNGYATIEIDNFDQYQLKDNVVKNNVTVIEYQCSNKWA
jgi:hypothetical protein